MKKVKKNEWICPVCNEVVEDIDINGSGVCNDCESEGWWMDPVGGIHAPDEDDPAAMYE